MNVFILGIDGLGRGVFEHPTKNIKALMEKSTVYNNMHTVFPPISAQAWGSLLLSVSPKKHTYTNEMIEDENFCHEFDKYPSLFRLISENKAEYELCSISNWNPINTGIFENIDNMIKETGHSDREITDKIISFVKRSGDNTALFVQLDEMDAAGHKYDYFTDEYYKELDKIDLYVGEILKTIDECGKSDNSLIIIMTDHGGGIVPKQHGINEVKDMGIFAIICGKTYEEGKIVSDKTSIMDIAPSILKQLDIKIPSHYEGNVLS